MLQGRRARAGPSTATALGLIFGLQTCDPRAPSSRCELRWPLVCCAKSHRALARNAFIHPFIQQLLAGNLSCAWSEKLGMTQTRLALLVPPSQGEIARDKSMYSHYGPPQCPDSPPNPSRVGSGGRSGLETIVPGGVRGWADVTPFLKMGKPVFHDLDQGVTLLFFFN